MTAQSLIARIKERQWLAAGSQDDSNPVVYVDDVEEIVGQELKRCEIRLISFSDIEDALTKHSKYLHTPLSGNERALIGDILRLLKPYHPPEPVMVQPPIQGEWDAERNCPKGQVPINESKGEESDG